METNKTLELVAKIFIIIGILFIVTGVLELLGKKTVVKRK